MMVGQPQFNSVPWRGPALQQEQTSGPAGSDISGGWLTGQPAYRYRSREAVDLRICRLKDPNSHIIWRRNWQIKRTD